MGQMGKVHVWLLIGLAVVCLGVFGYYLMTTSGPAPDVETVKSDNAGGAGAKTEETAAPASKQPAGPPVETARKVPESQPGPQKFPIAKEGEKDVPADTPENPPDTAQTNILKIAVGADIEPQIAQNPNYCSLIDGYLYDFFDYLNQKPYVEALHLDQNTLMSFQNILNRLAANPPLPAGERVDPISILKNMYHLYRVLGFTYIRLIKEVLQHEQDTLEINFDLFYKWLMSGSQCPQSGLERPPFNVTYLYAGYLLNTIGGRAYLFRRSPEVRLLASYYAILIVHHAEKEGKNSYGIDLLPYIAILREEIGNYSHLEFQMNYVDRLTELERYYRKKR